MLIHSNQNSKYKLLKKLKQKKYRISENKIILEGYRIINHAITIGKQPNFIVYREDFNDRLRNSNSDIVLNKALFNMITDTVNSQGVIAVFDMNIVGKDNPCSTDIVVINAVQDPGNLGTIIRTCDAFGFDRIMLTKGTVDPYSDKVLRSSMSSIFNVNMIIGIKSLDAINYLKREGFDICVTTPSASLVLDHFKKNKRSALVFGSEANGVEKCFFEVSDTKLKIEMPGNQESLNVASAVAIVLHKLK